MRPKKRLTALDTNAGKYSPRKVPRWNIGIKDIKEYVDNLLFEEFEEWPVVASL
ncbi:MAG: hypothetical protein KC476_00345 [Cyanobacteria bacterium HKST-UBA06]|nr:hypothetical protein [Cyanobacteria bacterium HKST-UBA05]MCA9799232.1 hypothetical protein [Cyanobacteria bacterium HKST-UBA04]MCA9806378.1 hypothetical protein [Cyanobacteria bacterium HKST-UBA06]MCA9841583.1 hypothetical protein [Cyanobacteria bacterium HKST-UBA03]